MRFLFSRLAWSGLNRLLLLLLPVMVFLLFTISIVIQISSCLKSHPYHNKNETPGLPASEAFAAGYPCRAPSPSSPQKQNSILFSVCRISEPASAFIHDHFVRYVELLTNVMLEWFQHYLFVLTSQSSCNFPLINLMTSALWLAIACLLNFASTPRWRAHHAGKSVAGSDRFPVVSLFQLDSPRSIF